MSDLHYHRGLSFEQIARLTDRQIAKVINLPRDEHGELIAPGRMGAGDVGPQPSAVEANVPEEALALAAERSVPTAFVLAWWQVWRSRQAEQQTTDADLLEKWREYLAAGTETR